MKQIFGYIRQYAGTLHPGSFITCTILLGIAVFFNYYSGIDRFISRQSSVPVAFFYRYILSLAAFALPYLVIILWQKQSFFRHPRFVLLLFIAPVIFAFKMEWVTFTHITDNLFYNRYWNQVLYWPVLLLFIIACLFIVWKTGLVQDTQNFYGIKTKEMNWKPYILMLLIMLPLITWASFQPDFLHTYPKIKMIAGIEGVARLSWWQKLLFELSYGSDFISIELFFRGFLILAFMKWAGPNAIIPMACFYCTIHFGKPLAECISSYFGGLLLGIIVLNTRSVLGGLMVHVGIAWLMELGGYWGLMRM